MSNYNKSYRIRTNVREDQFVEFNMTQDIDMIEILSLKINAENVYKLHSSKYGCLVGRVLANNSVGIPNAKVSVFIKQTDEDANNSIFSYLYPYTNVKGKNIDGIRYNLLPDVVNDKCHQDIGTFPNKRLVLDDNNVLEIYDTYYKFTATTNASGDYMIFGLPTGNNIIHYELDLSDIGILSQKPRDLFYKGYNHTQFENASQFKKSTELDSLTQVISQDDSVYVFPFWGDNDSDNVTTDTDQIKITRKDIDVNYKFEPTCIFIGSLVADERSQGFSKKCIPTDRMGKMDRLTTGAGTIEMIRKTPTGEVESFAIQGNDLIDGNGTWCYQIPMNLDYMKTDEYGNFVAAENAETGIPTRAKVRFRVSLADYESDTANAHLCKLLVPNNPQVEQDLLRIDYNFGTSTKEESFRNLFWNNVYTVKSYIPRIQYIRGGSERVRAARINRSKNFSGIKAVNVNGSNNPIPYNNMRIQLTFLFIFQCIIFKSLILVVKAMNAMIYVIGVLTCGSGCNSGSKKSGKGSGKNASDSTRRDGETNTSCQASRSLRYITIDGSMCPTLDGWYMALGAKKTTSGKKTNLKEKIVANTINWAKDSNIGNTTDNNNATVDSLKEYKQSGGDPEYSYSGWIKIDAKNATSEKFETDGATYTDDGSAEYKYSQFRTGGDEFGDSSELAANEIKVSGREDYFVKCVELQFAMEYEVIQFDFYNDWINGTLYFPRWFAELKRRKRVDKVKACNESYNTKHLTLVQQCAIEYNLENDNQVTSPGCGGRHSKCHKQNGRSGVQVLRKNGGIVASYINKDNRYLYYLKPVDYIPQNIGGGKIRVNKINLFSTDIVLLGSVLDCNKYGLPTAVGYPSSTYMLPPPTGQILDETQEMEMTDYTDSAFNGGNSGQFRRQNKKSHDFDEESEIELSGIDWGYNPFSGGDTASKDTTEITTQKGGHFLEIACTHAYSNSKSCVNLTRICELGGEMSQSHYYSMPSGNGSFVETVGIISTREVVGQDMRSKFASLNSNWLKTVTDNDTTYLQYDFTPFTPNKFDGALGAYTNSFSGESKSNGVIINSAIKMFESSSTSYMAYRLGLPGNNEDNVTDNLIKKFLIKNGNKVKMPVYENSFYFYFGLKDGNTAIDRLYTEYFSECVDNSAEEVVNKDGTTISAEVSLTSSTIKCKIDWATAHGKLPVKPIKYGEGKFVDTGYQLSDKEDFPKLDNIKGWKFCGWDYDPGYDVISDITITAKWLSVPEE